MLFDQKCMHCSSYIRIMVCRLCLTLWTQTQTFPLSRRICARNIFLMPHGRNVPSQGDTVVVRLPDSWVRKGQSPWSRPLNVVQVLERYSYRLSDGNKWNARRIKPWYSPTTVTCEAARPSSPGQQLRRSTRPRCPPDRYGCSVPWSSLVWEK